MFNLSHKVLRSFKYYLRVTVGKYTFGLHNIWVCNDGMVEDHSGKSQPALIRYSGELIDETRQRLSKLEPNRIRICFSLSSSVNKAKGIPNRKPSLKIEDQIAQFGTCMM